MPASHDQVPARPEALSTGWLTSRLRDAGVLHAGSVTAVHVEPGEKWNIAHTARVVLDYDVCEPGAPARLFVKIAEPLGMLDDLYLGEHAFYCESRTADLPLARCYDAIRDPASGRTCILLEDLGETHEEVAWPAYPDLPRCEAAIDALARLHAHWWRQGTSSELTPGPALEAHEQRLAAYVLDLLPAFFAALDDRLDGDRRAVVTRVCEKLPELKSARLTGGGAVTRIHGDPHFWNFLYPRDPRLHGCVLIDWEDWRSDSCGSDLAMMIALHWDDHHRRAHQDHLLRHYHDVLHRHMSGSYTWRELAADYRLGHLQNVVVPVFQLHMGHSVDNSAEHLARWFAAFEDLGCEVLL